MKNKSKLYAIYQMISEAREHKCTGCGRYSGQVALSHSHIISRAKRPDLTCEYDNITYHCLSVGEHTGCHNIWENGTAEEKMKLFDYEKNMSYIRRVDESLYNKLRIKEIDS
jgi:hypothetical protein